MQDLESAEVDMYQETWTELLSVAMGCKKSWKYWAQGGACSQGMEFKQMRCQLVQKTLNVEQKCNVDGDRWQGMYQAHEEMVERVYANSAEGVKVQLRFVRYLQELQMKRVTFIHDLAAECEVLLESGMIQSPSVRRELLILTHKEGIQHSAYQLFVREARVYEKYPMTWLGLMIAAGELRQAVYRILKGIRDHELQITVGELRTNLHKIASRNAEARQMYYEIRDNAQELLAWSSFYAKIISEPVINADQ